MNGWKKHGILFMIICLLLATPYSGWFSSVGSVQAAVSFEDGDGSELDPYQIATAEQLNEIRNNPTGHFLLIQNIDLSEDPLTALWDPIPNFSGRLDGGNFTISNLKILQEPVSGIGLFENVLSGGSVVNLTIHAIEIWGDYDVGILVGKTTGSTVIDNVSVSGAVYGWFNVGGLIGRSDSANVQISNVTADVDVLGHLDYTGGFIGRAHGAHISDSSIEGTVTGLRSYTGGGIGRADWSTLSNSFSHVDVTGQKEVGGFIGRTYETTATTLSSTGEITGSDYVGGLIGQSMMNSKVFESSATGSVSGAEVVGGLIGGMWENSVVSNSSASGFVGGTDDYVGGLIGYVNDSSVSHSTASGAVSGLIEYVGGFIGYVYKGEVTNNTALGTVTGVGNVGGLIGMTSDSDVLHSTASGAVSGEDHYVGGLIGRTDSGFTSKNSASGSVTSIGGGYVGGLIGQNRDGDVSDSFASGEVKANLRYIGGLIGRNRGGDVEKSYATGNVIGEFGAVSGNYGQVGGLIGRNTDGDEIRDSYATGNVTANSDYVGGLVGNIGESSRITASYATGDVVGENYVGGLAGLLYDGEISYSYASGNAKGCLAIGGIVGDNYTDGEIRNSYARGNVTGLCSSAPNSGDAIGGLVGDNRGDIVNSYSSGLVTGDTQLGGLVGYGRTEGTITNSYYDLDVSGQSDHKGQGLTHEQMKNSANYESWDFGTVWVADEHNDQYPYLVKMQDKQAYLTYMGNDDLNANSSLYASNPYKLGSTVTIEDLNWTRPGHVFQGWNTKSDGTGQQYDYGETETLNGNLLLYGLWMHAEGVFAGGNGTTGDPFQIATAEQLNVVRSYPESHFILVNDIDLSTHALTIAWEPIPDFSGSLDGDNKTITNVKMDQDLTSNVGLFSKLSGGEIKNLIIDAAEVKGYENVGILAGQSNDSANINHVRVSGAVYGDSHVGGLIGQSGDSNISNSMADVEVTAQSRNIGGLIGAAMNTPISNSSAIGNISGSRGIGGLVGSITDGNVSKSYATGAIEGIKSTGGLVGWFGRGTITESYATGHVMGANDAGGLVGNFDEAEMTYSFATGNVQGCDDVGGLVSDNEGKISNSYATGNVTGWCISGPNDMDSIGGLVGDNASGEIANSFSIGKVIGGKSVGGLVGYNGSGTITNSYYDLDLSGQSDDQGQGLTSEQMKDLDNYDGWDFGTIWNIDEHHDGYPYLVGMQVFLTYIGNDSNVDPVQYVSKFYRGGSSVTIEDLQWTKPAYRFLGWNTESDGSGLSYGVGETFQLNRDLLLYANWQPIPTLSNNANLASLQIFADDAELILSPAFAADKTSYRAETTSSEVTISLTASDAEAAVSLDDEELEGEGTVLLVEGDNVFEIVVKAEDGTLKTYDLTIHREEEPDSVQPTPEDQEEEDSGSGGFGWLQSANANLANLKVVINGEELELSPAFAAEKTSYRAETASSEATIKVTPSDARATVSLEAERIVGEEKVVLEEGDNAFELIVRAENGTSKPYRLTIHRIATPEEVEAPVCTFSDVKGHWAESFICEAFERGIVNGHTETMFSPQSGITRVEFASMMLRTLGMTSSASSLREHGFVDQNQIPAWAETTVRIAVENGILHGYPDQSLRPLDNVSRAEMVAMMGRALEWEISTRDTAFHDDGDIPNWSKGYIREAVARGLLVGRGNNRFSPSESGTRAEATVMLLRLWHALDVLHSESTE